MSHFFKVICIYLVFTLSVNSQIVPSSSSFDLEGISNRISTITNYISEQQKKKKG